MVTNKNSIFCEMLMVQIFDVYHYCQCLFARHLQQWAGCWTETLKCWIIQQLNGWQICNSQ